MEKSGAHWIAFIKSTKLHYYCYLFVPLHYVFIHCVPANILWWKNFSYSRYLLQIHTLKIKWKKQKSRKKLVYLQSYMQSYLFSISCNFEIYSPETSCSNKLNYVCQSRIKKKVGILEKKNVEAEKPNLSCELYFFHIWYKVGFLKAGFHLWNQLIGNCISKECQICGELFWD